MAVYQLENEHIYLEVASHGAELVRLVGKKTKKEYLFDGDPKYWKRHSPILFPVCRWCENKEYRYNGKTYTMTQHGFARDSEFKCIHDRQRNINLSSDINRRDEGSLSI